MRLTDGKLTYDQHPLLENCGSLRLQGIVALVMAWSKPLYQYVGRNPDEKLGLPGTRIAGP
jgi:hypothetical protein